MYIEVMLADISAITRYRVVILIKNEIEGGRVGSLFH